ncbi:MAG: glycogen debranching enzyme family protein [Anaerolineales bacterium]|nr:glycogen debranching enzyme family protein [Anaerolineales bacterium]
MITFGRDLTGDFASASRREWWVTNGLGGWASGTVSGANTRRYHGLFVPALAPPLGRTVLVEKLNEQVLLGGQAFPLSSNEYADGTIHPHGYRHIETFQLEAGLPVWRFALAECLLEKRVWMAHGANTVYVTYTHARAGRPLDLDVLVMTTHRDAHGETSGKGWEPIVVPTADGAVVHAHATGTRLRASGGRFSPVRQWHWRVRHRVETGRGLPDLEDQFAAGRFEVTLNPGETWALVISLNPQPGLDWAEALAAARDRAVGLIAQARAQAEPAWVKQLVLAADQFIVRRGDGYTVLAGYPWFGDWGRDTMIALPGLTLNTRRTDVAASVLRTFARYISDGMLPNRFPDVGEQPEYNTVDATLWYFHALERYVAATGDLVLASELWPSLEDIIAWYRRGTRFGIHVDPADGLLYAGQPDVQLTWMDAKVNGRVITPRIGKPVEINALWINALRVMARLAKALKTTPRADYAPLALQAEASFEQFWYAEGGYLYDVIGGPDGPDPSLRPNQLIAVALPAGPLAAAEQRERAAQVVAACGRALLTSYGLRSLAPGHPGYVSRFNGPAEVRDAAYHQGTVWAWLIGPFVDAYLRVSDDPATARSFLAPFAQHLADDGLGSVAEVFEPEPPFAPGGCPAQAWSVAEVLRAWCEAAPPRARRPRAAPNRVRG